ncbi:MAG: hypothetical protein F6K11_18245, partial [Leptolyngbya sp. SIO3F4]|nr:hypothetical protein [Leptolyngbya sp. SIO3F4]
MMKKDRLSTPKNGFHKVLSKTIFKLIFSGTLLGLASPSFAVNSIVWIDSIFEQAGLLYYDNSSCPENSNERDEKCNDLPGRQLQRRNQKIRIRGNNRSHARLLYTTTPPIDDGEMAIQLGPTNQQTEYFYPCSGANGEFRIHFNRGSESSGCRNGVEFNGNWNNIPIVFNPNYSITSSKSTTSVGSDYIAQSRDSEYSNFVVFKPVTNEKSYIEVQNDIGTELVVNVLQGDFTARTADGQTRLIPEGRTYSYNGEEISIEQLTSQEISSIVNSAETQDFLDSDNWGV